MIKSSKRQRKDDKQVTEVKSLGDSSSKGAKTPAIYAALTHASFDQIKQLALIVESWGNTALRNELYDTCLKLGMVHTNLSKWQTMNPNLTRIIASFLDSTSYSTGYIIACREWKRVTKINHLTLKPDAIGALFVAAKHGFCNLLPKTDAVSSLIMQFKDDVNIVIDVGWSWMLPYPIPKLVSLTLDGFYDYPHGRSIHPITLWKTFVEQIPSTVKELVFDTCHPEQFSHLNHLTNLDTLVIRGGQLLKMGVDSGSESHPVHTFESMMEAHSGRLKRLELSDCQYFVEKTEMLCYCLQKHGQALQTLGLNYNLFKDPLSWNVCSFLKDCTNLTCLAISNEKNGTYYESVEEFKASTMDTSPSVIVQLNRLVNLKELHLPLIKSSDFAQLCKLKFKKPLEILSVGLNGGDLYQDGSLGYLHSPIKFQETWKWLSEIGQLTLNVLRVTKQALRAIFAMTNLTKLILQGDYSVLSLDSVLSDEKDASSLNASQLVNLQSVVILNTYDTLDILTQFKLMELFSKCKRLTSFQMDFYDTKNREKPVLLTRQNFQSFVDNGVQLRKLHFWNVYLDESAIQILKNWEAFASHYPSLNVNVEKDKEKEQGYCYGPLQQLNLYNCDNVERCVELLGDKIVREWGEGKCD